MFFEKYFISFYFSVSPSTLLFQYFNLTTFLLLESGCKGIGFNNTSQTYLSFFLIRMKLFCNLLIHKCISHEQF